MRTDTTARRAGRTPRPATAVPTTLPTTSPTTLPTTLPTGVLAAVLAAGLAVALAACGGGGDDGGGGAEGDATQGSALDEALGLPGYDEGSEDQFAQEQQQVEESIATCMADKGFEYLPVDYGDFDAGEFTEEDQAEYARRNGFGVALRWGNPEFDQGGFGGGDEFVDPNAEIVEGFSESELTAYYEALDGTEEERAQYETTEVDPETGEEYTVQEGAGAGCRGDAQRAVTGDRDAVYSAAEQFWTEIGERTEADPRIQELNERWSACMSDAGFDYEDSEAVYDYAYGDFTEKAREVLGFDPNSGPVDTLTPEQQEELYALEPEAYEARIAELADQALAGVDRDALDALHEEERSLAVAESECSRALYTDSEDIYREIEAAYVEENADRIAEVVEGLETGGAGASAPASGG